MFPLHPEGWSFHKAVYMKNRIVLSDSDIMETLSLENIAAIMKELNYGDDTWKPKGENHERT